MASRIVVPDAGQTTDELLLVKWHVSVGDEVEVGDFLCDIETDKAVAELESHAAGHVLQLTAEEGDTVTTGQTLLWIGKPGETVPEEPDDAPAPESRVSAAPEPATAAEASGEGGAATPAARTLARERGIDLTDLRGTGPDGCIVKRDVLGATATASPGRSVPLSSMRRAITARLQQSVREAPQFHVAIDADMTHALAAREASGTKVSVTDLLVKAAADVLARFPQANCRLEGDRVLYAEDVNIGIAVSLDEGLVVPVLAGADRLPLGEVASRSRQLVAEARAGKLAVGAQSTFTVSNLGMYGIRSFTAIVNPPEAAILAVGAIHDRLVLGEAGPVAVPTLTLTLTCDHRIIDGAVAAQFLAALKQRLEDPAAWSASLQEASEP